jgi:transcription elongation factor SPT5
VVEAIEGVRGLLQYTMKLVPIGDMTTVLTVVPKNMPGMQHDYDEYRRSIFAFLVLTDCFLHSLSLQ